MRLVRLFVLFSTFLFALAAGANAPVHVIPVEGAIGPAIADFVHRGIERAQDEGSQLVVLRMDTPGGLDTSMRAIIKDILSSKVPVATFVSPSGARAASAGTFILYASHIAAMAPGTNLGAASPVAIGAPGGGPRSPLDGKRDEGRGDERKDTPKSTGPDAGGQAKDRDAARKDDSPNDKPAGSRPLSTDPSDTLTRKSMNDASAYIRSLAQLRGRNAEWGERAVREAVSLSSSEALELKVIEIVADDLDALLASVDGRTLSVAGKTTTLATKGAPVVRIEADWRTRLLATITNPSVAYLLIIVGIYALIFEFSNPGLLLPGVVGAICLLIALYAFQLLPVNYAGVALILLGIAFMAAEAFIPSFGALGIGGVVAFVIGSVILFDTGELPGFEVPYALIGGVSAASALFLVFVLGMIVRGRRRPVVSGRESLLGARAEALDDFSGEGWARVQGERWHVRATAPIRRGQSLRVTAIDGLWLEVQPEQNQHRGD